MVAVFSFLAVIAISLLIVRIATVALSLTGLSQQLARFQARSAFTGAGFTTTESEKVVQHPVRRRIIMLLMLLGNAGVVTAVSSLMLSFIGAEQTLSTPARLGFLAVGLAGLWWLATSSWVDRQLSRIIGWALKRFTSVDARDYAGLLHLTGDYVVAELSVNEKDWLSGGKLRELRLNSEGLLVLGVERLEGRYQGAPRGETVLHPGDTVLLYGRREVIAELDDRGAGAKGAFKHMDNVQRQKQLEAAESEEETSSETSGFESTEPVEEEAVAV